MRWGTTSKLFHWLGAALIFFLLIHGFWMVTFPPRELRFGHYETHAAVGYLLIALTLARLVWRWTHEVPLDSFFGWFRVPALVSVWWRKDGVMQRMLR